MKVETVLAAVAEIGPFFRIGELPNGSLDPAEALAALYRGGTALQSQLSTTADTLGVPDGRVAGSIFFQSLAAKLWSPTLAVAVRDGQVLWLPPEATRLQGTGLACARPTLRTPRPTGSTGEPVGDTVRSGTVGSAPSGRQPTPSDRVAALAGELVRAVLDIHLRPLAAVLNVSPATLWGNAASAMAGSYQVMTAARPELAAPTLIHALLGTDSFAGTGGVDGSGRFQRNSCCLFYRVPGGGLCGDCVLRRRGFRTRPTD